MVETATGNGRAVTESRIGGLREDDLVDVELVTLPDASTAARSRPGSTARTASGRVPVVLAIHGGPEAQERPVYQPALPVPAQPRHRRAGDEHPRLDRLRQDVSAARSSATGAAATCRTGSTPSSGCGSRTGSTRTRIGVYGGSYGGFAVLTCVTRLPDYWAAAVDIFGPSNLVTFAKAVPPTWRRMMKRFVGDPDEDADFLTRALADHVHRERRRRRCS